MFTQDITKTNMPFKDKLHHQEVDPARILDRHRVEMMKMREHIASKYREAKIGLSALQTIQEGGHSHHSLGKSRNLFANAAHQYLREENPRDADAKMYASILAVVPHMVDGRHTLHDHHASRQERHDAKLEMIEFNDVLRTIIDTNPNIREDTLKGLIISAMLGYGYGADDLNGGKAETKSALIGMKHELAFESALSWLPEGYEILTTTDEDDKHGADFKVRCPNGVILYIDVKATPESAYEATEDNVEFYARFHEQVPKNQLVLYSGFGREDFTDQHPWRPTDESVQRTYPDLEAQLHRASVETLQQLELERAGKIKVGKHS